MNTFRTFWAMLLLALLITPFSPSPAQPEDPLIAALKRGRELIERVDQRSGDRRQAAERARSITSQAIDVEHYRLQIQLTPSPAWIAGRVTINGKTTAPVNTIAIDVYDNLYVSSVQFNGQEQDVQQSSDHIVLDFPEALPADESFTIVVEYQGPPVTSGIFGGGMLVSQHDGVPVIGTLSEPYAGPTWWPSVDDPTDKATAEIEITVPEGYFAASNGALENETTNDDQTVTYFWRTRYQTATYLISVTATNYAQFEDSYTALDGVTTMPVIYYVYPEHLQRAQEKFTVTRRAIEIFAPLFGEYPFIDEKYGTAEFPWSGAMEHQTVTSMGERVISFSDFTIQDFLSHELSHHWWGDMVTMKTWHDIWLNEGFATYSEVLFFERFLQRDPGELMDQAYDDGRALGHMRGTVYAENLDNPFDDSGAIYTKGAWVLHMLRRVLGEDQFFAALKDYGQRFAFSNASTQDFQRVCEDHYGAPLDWFFQQWIFAPARPVYRASSRVSGPDESGQYTVTLTIRQTQSQPIPGREGDLENVYIMPIDVTIHYLDGSSERRVVWNNERVQEFSFAVSKRPIRAGIDEGHWVLKELQ